MYPSGGLVGLALRVHVFHDYKALVRMASCRSLGGSPRFRDHRSCGPSSETIWGPELSLWVSGHSVNLHRRPHNLAILDALHAQDRRLVGSGKCGVGPLLLTSCGLLELLPYPKLPTSHVDYWSYCPTPHSPLSTRLLVTRGACSIQSRDRPRLWPVLPRYSLQGGLM